MPAWPLLRFGNLRRVVCDCAVNRVKYTQTVKGNIKHLHETQQYSCAVPAGIGFYTFKRANNKGAD